ncbi:MAG: polysaccharide deacetylase family protein [Melioribacteraceae bacterium]|nr:polysaccharide deacetylase family protein [Melioribacteraceae bacterium]
MALGETKGLRVNYLIIFLSGLVLLIVGILIFLLVIRNIYGKYEVDEIIPSKKNLEVLYKEKQYKVAILYSKYTERMLDPGSTWLQDNVDTWKKFVSNAKYKYDIIYDSDIEVGNFMEYKILVLPGTKSLSDKQLIKIKKYIENGGSLFVTGGPATFSDEGKWRGWDFFTEIFGIKFNKEIKPEETFKIHTLRGNLPITAGIPSGYTLKIATWDRPIYAEVLEPRTVQVSFWFDFRKEAGLVREQINRSAGIAYGSYGKGRFVWYGFEINSVLGIQKDFIFFERLFNNSLNWLTYNPTAYVKDWPSPYESAAIFIPTLGNEIYNINNILPLIRKKDLPATFFVSPEDAAENKGLIKNLSRVGSIGTITDIGFISSPEDTVNSLFSKEIQEQTIMITRDSLNKATGSDIKAIMPLYGYYDDNTVQVLTQNGFDFLVTDSLTDRSVPEVKIMDGKPIMVITKTARDDIDIVKNYGLTDPKFQQYTYEEDIDRVQFEGGLYVLKVHTEYQLQPQYVGVLQEILKYLKKKNIWITSLEDLKAWWLRRNVVEVRYETRSKRRIAVELNNPSDKVSKDVVIEVHVNKKIKNVEVSADIINTKIPKFELKDEGQTIFFYLDRMEPHETRALLVDFDNA